VSPPYAVGRDPKHPELLAALATLGSVDAVWVAAYLDPLRVAAVRPPPYGQSSVESLYDGALPNVAVIVDSPGRSPCAMLATAAAV